jgi:hypothetical protein
LCKAFKSLFRLSGPPVEISKERNVRLHGLQAAAMPVSRHVLPYAWSLAHPSKHGRPRQNPAAKFCVPLKPAARIFSANFLWLY